VPRSPVDKEQDVAAAFFLHHRLECFDQLGGKEARAPRRLEETNREDAVDAFAVAREGLKVSRSARQHSLL
jgi:hypothetical protein